MTHLSVHEWGRVGVHNNGGPTPHGQFSRHEADALLAAARAHPLSGQEGTVILIDHHRHLTAQQMVGVIAAAGCSLEILPKIDPKDVRTDSAIRQQLVRMLDVALNLNLSHGQTAAMARQNETLLDILIRLFADRLLSEARRGLPRAYMAEQGDLSALCGRLDVVQQFTHNAVRPDRLACRFDTLAIDTPLLRIMKACVTLLRQYARLAETVRRLDELRYLLADVRDVSARALEWTQVRIDRTNLRWESLYALARLFLRREWQATHHDASKDHGITLLFPMNKLFEAYIAALTKRSLRRSNLTVRTQGGLRYCLREDGDGGKKRFQTKPDILIEDGSKVELVIDTKWKRIGSDLSDAKRGVSQADIYQMMAYARLYQPTEVLLLYPHHPDLGVAALNASYSMFGGMERMRIASIDLVLDERAIVHRLKDLTSTSLPLSEL